LIVYFQLVIVSFLFGIFWNSGVHKISPGHYGVLSSL